MNLDTLPVGENPPALEFTHFPTRQQAFVWRNWEMVSATKLAEILGTKLENVMEMATGMGLPSSPYINGKWLSHGYATIIRANWHLLGYGQLIELLGWTVDKMLYALKEEDFLFQKLGRLKPHCGPLKYKPLDEREKAITRKIKEFVLSAFPDINNKPQAEPFSFLDSSFGATGEHAEIRLEGKTGRPLQLIYPYTVPYGDPLIYSDTVTCPDHLLDAYAESGVNAIWLQAVLYSLIPFDRAPEYSSGFETRIKNLKSLVNRASEHGIKVYLYFNEPRAMPFAFFEKYPEWKGAENDFQDIYAICTSSPALEDLKARTAALFRLAPNVAGAFTITASENFTNCRSHGPLCDGGNFGGKTVYGCPRCKVRPPEEIMVEINKAISEGVFSVNRDADFIAWTWGWKQPVINKAIALLPKKVKVMCVSEDDMPAVIGGVPGRICDYSISQPGPGPAAKEIWEAAAANGLGRVAKVQMNNTWECSAVPYIPVPELLLEHLGNIRKSNVNDLMLSWTLGGYPSMNLVLVNEFHARGDDDYAQLTYNFSEKYFGAAAAPGICEAYAFFSSAFREFPEFAGGLYCGPQTLGPANLLYPKNTGYAACMTSLAYDDLECWRGGKHNGHIEFPADKYEGQFKKLSELWKAGLDMLLAADASLPWDKRGNYEDLRNVSETAYCHFRSTYLQIRFVRLRAEGNDEMIALVSEEAELASRLCAIVRKDSRIGFESANQYYYDAQALREKALNCECLKEAYHRLSASVAPTK